MNLPPIRPLLLKLALAAIATTAALAQSNDAFSGRTVLTGTSVTAATASNVSATTEPGEPSGHRYRTLWYTWTAPQNLNVTLSDASQSGDVDGMFVYIGDSLANLTRVHSTTATSLSWTAVQGVTYQIAVDAYYATASTGTFTLVLTSSPFGSGSTVVGPDLPTSSAPANDNLAHATALPTLPAVIIAYPGGGTKEAGEPGAGYSTLWYRFTAQTDVNLLATVEAYVNFPKVAVYHGDTFATMAQIAEVGSGGSFTVPLKAGSTYCLQIGNQTSGTTQNVIQVSLAATAIATSGTLVGPALPTSAAPTNDNFASRQVLSGAKLTVFGVVTNAARESFEPAGDGYNTLWYAWATNLGGTATIGPNESLSSSTTRVTVYTGSDIANLTQIATATYSSRATFTVLPNTTYLIALASNNSGGTGTRGFDLSGPGAGTSATDEALGSRLVNISTRAVIATGGNLNPGFVISGNVAKTVLIRGVGPTMAPYGVPNTMADPIVRVYSGNDVIATNDNWSAVSADATALSEAAATVGAFPLLANSKDAALLLTLAPGVYTAVVASATGDGGDTLVEVYELP